MKYPRANNYLTYRRMEGDRCLVTNFSGKGVSSYEIDMETARFLNRLDGKTPPQKCLPGASDTEIKEILKELKNEGLLRTWGKAVSSGIGCLKVTVWIPGKKARRSCLPGLWNLFLILSWFPILCMGILLLMNNSRNYMAETVNGAAQILIGFLGGITAGMILHELSHGAAAIRYGAKVFEFGFFLKFFLPGAYTELDERRVRNRWHRIQIYAAGVEANLWLAGVCLILGSVFKAWSAGMCVAAIINLFLGLSNLEFWMGLDGMYLFSEIMGTSDFIEKAIDIAFDRSCKRALVKKMGASGYALIFAVHAVLVFQVLLPLSILANLLSLWL